MEKKMDTKKYYTKPLIEIIHCQPIQALCTSITKTWSLGDCSGVEPLDGRMIETDGTNFDGWEVQSKKYNVDWDEW